MLATVSRPEICVLPARIAPPVYSQQSGNISSINVFVKIARDWRPEIVSKYASSSRPFTPARGGVDGQIGARGGEMYCGLLSLARRSGVVPGDQSPERKCRLGYVRNLKVPNTEWSMPRPPIYVRVHQQTGNQPRVGGAYASSETSHHVSLSREVYAPWSGHAAGYDGS